MKLNYKKIYACATLLAISGTALGQNTYSGYFLDNYQYRYQMNPAFANETNFVSMPTLGNINIGLEGSLNLKNVVFPVNGKTLLFTNPEVGVSQVMNGLKDTNKLNFDVKLPILAGGFKAWGGYNTITISACAGAYAGIPKEFFSLAKEGISNRKYDISNMRVQGMGYAELAFGHSHDLCKYVPGLKVGGTLKFLIGAGNVDAYLRTADLTLGTDNWIARTNADIYASVKGLEYEHDYNVDTGKEYVSGVKMDKFSIQGFGMGLDLGAAYDMGDWQFSLAILDLGFISFPETHYATTDGLQTVETDAYTFSADDNAPNSFSNEWDRLKTNAYALYQLIDKGDIGERTRSLATTLNFGAQYEFPLYRNLHFGLMNSTRINGMFTTTEFRLSTNVRPVKCFSADANVAVGTYGTAFGWMLNLNTKGFNFFVGMDNTLGKLSKQGVPLNSHAEVNLGINFPF